MQVISSGQESASPDNIVIWVKVLMRQLCIVSPAIKKMLGSRKRLRYYIDLSYAGRAEILRSFRLLSQDREGAELKHLISPGSSQSSS